MTILNKILIFNKPQKEIDCCSCKGTGKVKTLRTCQSTTIFCFIVVCVFIFSALSLASTGRLWIVLPLFLISSFLGILILKEYKEQIKGVN